MKRKLDETGPNDVKNENAHSTISDNTEPVLKTIQPSIFYSTPYSPSWLKRLARIRGNAPITSKKEQDPPKSSSPGKESQLLKEFFKQQAAFEYINEQIKQDPKLTNAQHQLCTFSFERDNQGGRKYIVCTLDHFWDYYNALNHNNRHYYEEGSPCNLYFDLEFLKELNPTRDGDLMVDVLIEIVNFQLAKHFGMHTYYVTSKDSTTDNPSGVAFEKIEVTRSNVIDLDSTTDTKFSRHLIFRIPNCCFENNLHCGNFVFLLLSNLPELKQNFPLVDELFVMNDKGKSVFFADVGVYTRNRNFRLYGSSKVGKNSFLVPSAQNEYPKLNEKQFFMDSLVCNVTDVKFKQNGKYRILSCGDTKNYRTGFSLQQLNNVLQNYLTQAYANVNNNNNTTIPLDELKPGIRDLADVSIGTASEPVHHGSDTKSPFPLIDSCIANSGILHRGGVDGSIRGWIYFPSSKFLIYNIAKNRYCENIKRQHKSNHIFMMVDLNKKVFCQKCYDSECRMSGFRSEEHLLPQECWEAYFGSEVIDAETIQKRLESDMFLLPDSVLAEIDFE